MSMNPETITRGSIPEEIQYPMNFSNFVETLLTAGIPGITPYFIRASQFVPTGATKILTVNVPNGAAGMLIKERTLYADTFSPNLLVTAEVDTNSPLLESVPMNSAIKLSGSFVRIVQTKTVYTIQNNDVSDITFYDDTQVALLSSEAMRRLIEPIFQYGGTIINDLASYSRNATA